MKHIRQIGHAHSFIAACTHKRKTKQRVIFHGLLWLAVTIFVITNISCEPEPDISDCTGVSKDIFSYSSMGSTDPSRVDDSIIVKKSDGTADFTVYADQGRSTNLILNTSIFNTENGLGSLVNFELSPKKNYIDINATNGNINIKSSVPSTSQTFTILALQVGGKKCVLKSTMTLQTGKLIQGNLVYDNPKYDGFKKTGNTGASLSITDYGDIHLTISTKKFASEEVEYTISPQNDNVTIKDSGDDAGRITIKEEITEAEAVTYTIKAKGNLNENYVGEKTYTLKIKAIDRCNNFEEKAKNSVFNMNAQDKYEITNWGELVYLSIYATLSDEEKKDKPGLDNNYILTDDILLPQYACAQKDNFEATQSLETSFIPIGDSKNPFKGTFDGGEHTIKGLYINTEKHIHVGLFGVIEGKDNDSVMLKDLTLENPKITSRGKTMSAGSFVGQQKKGKLDEIHTSGGEGFLKVEVQPTPIGTGGLVGISSGKIDGASSDVDVGGKNELSNANTGGLVGELQTGGTVSGGSATGTVTGANNTGGLVGYAAGTVSGGSATGSVTGADNTGGLVGYAAGTVSGGSATGSVTGADNTGGLVGYATETVVSDGSATGSVTGADNTGGLVGYATETVVSDGSATGSVTGANNTGGLVGYATKKSVTGYATGAVKGGSNTGGLVGRSTHGCEILGYATGTVDASVRANEVGGLVGSAGGNVTGYATGDVTGGDGSSSLGGLVGFGSDSSRIKGYATNAVSGTNSVGGFVGLTYGTIFGYSKGEVSGKENTGGLVGYSSSTSATPPSQGYARTIVKRTEGKKTSFGKVYGNIVDSPPEHILFYSSESAINGGPDGNILVDASDPPDPDPDPDSDSDPSSGSTTNINNNYTFVTRTAFRGFNFNNDDPSNLGEWAGSANDRWPAINLSEMADIKGAVYKAEDQPTAR